jgi:hypothetical protein
MNLKHIIGLLLVCIVFNVSTVCANTFTKKFKAKEGMAIPTKSPTKPCVNQKGQKGNAYPGCDMKARQNTKPAVKPKRIN